MVAGVAVFALLVIMFVSLSAWLGRAYLTGPLVFIVAGAVLGRTQLADEVGSSTIRIIAEVTLALLLFHDAAQLQPREMRRDSVFTGRLLLVGLPLTIAAGYLVARGLFPDTGVWLPLLLAAALAPTDAGLGAATVLNPVVPVRVRRILNVESGLNDGLATPVVLLAIAAAAGADHGHGVPTALREISVGALVGVLAGVLSGRLIQRARRSGWTQEPLVPFATLAVPLLCYFGAVELGGNGYIAAFVAGTAFASSQDIERTRASLELTDQVAALLGYAVWLLFGVIVATNLGPFVHWQTLFFAVLSLTVLRMVPVAISLLGSGLQAPTVLFIGWFGPRGLASVVFALIAFESLESDPDAMTVLAVIAMTIILSVVVHGISATPWARVYGAWAQRVQPEIETKRSVEPTPIHRSSGT
jgi:sodium/hydrogen antiporter